METIGTLINNLKTKFDEQADNEILLGIANKIVSNLQTKVNQSNFNYSSIPTLAYQEPVSIPVTKKNETEQQEDAKSLNDILKEDKTEVSHVLENIPVKDLRKAININDRFVFISELFNGNESLYDASVKSLNGINNVTEAEAWIETELKQKLNWNDENEFVQHFYKLVKKRYL